MTAGIARADLTPIEVETPSGVLRCLRGPDVVVARGVRYATAHRFGAPEPAASWTGVRDATEYGPVCPQPASLLTSTVHSPHDEDCLVLNVWAPREALVGGGVPLPVLVWIHGGGFTTGMGHLAWYDGANLARRGVVVVTINYRLGPLGFCHLEPFGGERFAGSANLGLLDQAAALRWVGEHIGAFGGDPDRVTIFGESAGGMSVTTHLGLPASEGWFHRAVAQSGAAHYVWDQEGAARIAHATMTAIGVDRPEALLEVPAAAFVEAQAAIGDPDRPMLPLPFRPTVDGTTLPAHPLDAPAPVPYLAGTNLDEMRLWTVLGALAGEAPAPIDDASLKRKVGRLLSHARGASEVGTVIATYRRRLGDAPPTEVLSAIGTDLTFRIPALEALDVVSRSAPAFAYLFTHPTTSFGGALGAAHATEIPYVFDNLDQPGTELMLGEITPDRRRLATQMADAWVAFASTGDPSTPGLGDWPTYDADARATMVIDLEAGVVEDPHGDERRIWMG
jgi:para-nitrobenzyl esterase